jgi:hypothetical protein
MVPCDRASGEKSRHAGTSTRKLGAPRTGRESAVRTIFVAVLILGSTASYSNADDPPDLENRPNPCEDPLLLELRAEPMDSLSERQFEMLKILEERCTKYGDPTQGTLANDSGPSVVDGNLSRQPSAMIIGGVGIPVGEFKDRDTKIGIGGTLRVEVPLGDRVSLGPSLGYHRFGFEEFTGDGRWEISAFGLGLSSVLDDGADVFWGAGVALPDAVTSSDWPFGSDEAKATIDASPFVEGGLRLGLRRGPFMELTYFHIFTHGKSVKTRYDGQELSSRLRFDIHWVAARVGIKLMS